VFFSVLSRADDSNVVNDLKISQYIQHAASTGLASPVPYTHTQRWRHHMTVLLGFWLVFDLTP